MLCQLSYGIKKVKNSKLLYAAQALFATQGLCGSCECTHLPQTVHRIAHHEGALKLLAVKINEAVGEIDFLRCALPE